jgi:hypothetical protein
MAYTAHPTVTTGATWSAANQNTYVRDNLAALWVFTTAGDMIYATSSSAANRLAIGAAGSLLRVTGTAPAWMPKGSNVSTLVTEGGNSGWSANSVSPYAVFRLNAAGTASEFSNILQKTVIYSSVDKTVPGGAVTAMAMNAEVIDDGAWHSTVTNNSRITPGVAGWYLAMAHAQISHTGTDPFCRSYIRKTGTAYVARAGSWGFGGYSVELECTSQPFAMGATDYIELMLESVSGDRTMVAGSDTSWLALMRLQ